MRRWNDLSLRIDSLLECKPCDGQRISVPDHQCKGAGSNPTYFKSYVVHIFFSFSKSKFYRTYRDLIPDPAFITHSKRSDLKISQKKRLVFFIQLSRYKLQHCSKFYPKLYDHLQLRKISTTNMIIFHAAKKIASNLNSIICTIKSNALIW